MLKKARTVVAWAMSLALVYMAGGCAIFQRGPSDEELLHDLLCTYVTSLEEADIEKQLSIYSKDFVGANGENYDQAAAGLEQIMPQLQNVGLEISTEQTSIEIEGKEAEIGPIVFEFNQGGIEITLLTTKEDDGCWRVTSSRMQQ